MRKEIGVDPDAIFYTVYDAETQEVIPCCTMADSDKGRYVQYLRGEDGEFISDEVTGDPMLITRFGNIELRDSRKDILPGKENLCMRKLPEDSE